MSEEEIVTLMGQPTLKEKQSDEKTKLFYEANTYYFVSSWPFIHVDYATQFKITLKNDEAVFKTIFTDVDETCIDLVNKSIWNNP